jgi:hypothetical protein
MHLGAHRIKDIEQITKADPNACHTLCSKCKALVTLRRLSSTVLRKTQVIAKDNGHCLLEIVYSKTQQIFIAHEISYNWNSPGHGRRHY